MPTKTRFRFVARPPMIAGALAAGGAVLLPLDSAVNRQLTGAPLLLALGAGALALVLLVESTQRARLGFRWRATTAGGTLCAIASLVLVLNPFASARAEGLRLTVEQTAPGLFDVALPQAIGQPTASVGWAQLHAQGGIDVYSSQLHVTLANTSPKSLTVNTLQLEVIHSSAPPRGTLANEYSQGSESLAHFGASLPTPSSGAVSPVYEMSPNAGDVTTGAVDGEPYFLSHYISLSYGEIYPLSLTVQTRLPGELTYRLLVRGSTPQSEYSATSGPLRIVGPSTDTYRRLYARYYTKGHDPKACTPTPANPWVDSSPLAHSKACPYGLGLPYSAPPLTDGKTSSHQASPVLAVAVRRGAQGVSLGGVGVAAPPAAQPVSGVVPSLLRALGDWQSCTVYYPTVHYWSAHWEAAGLSVIFQGGQPCTATDGAHVAAINTGRRNVTVTSNLGPVSIESPLSTLPPALVRAGTYLPDGTFRRELVISGVKPCAPTQPDSSRTQPGENTPGGILGIGQNISRGIITGVTVTPATSSCTR
jgi:hypothetical protein